MVAAEAIIVDRSPTAVPFMMPESPVASCVARELSSGSALASSVVLNPAITAADVIATDN